MSLKISPTHGANLPSKPINIESLICDFIKSFELLVSKILQS